VTVTVIGWFISDSGSYRLFSGSDSESTLIFQGGRMEQGKGVVASSLLVMNKSGI
jgi:hypothetical protein